MLLAECVKAGVEIKNPAQVKEITKTNGGFGVKTDSGNFNSRSVVIATGGLSVPKIGASDFGHRMAEKFGLGITPTRPALVPLTFSGDALEKMKALAGVSQNVKISNNQPRFFLNNQNKIA